MVQRKGRLLHIGDTFNPEKKLKLNTLEGNIGDETAKIFPFTVMRGKQPYDSRNRYLLPYSGRYDFIETEMIWSINHMVAPVAQTLKCRACHLTGNSGRLVWNQLGYAGDPIKTGGRFR